MNEKSEILTSYAYKKRLISKNKSTCRERKTTHKTKEGTSTMRKLKKSKKKTATTVKPKLKTVRVNKEHKSARVNNTIEDWECVACGGWWSNDERESWITCSNCTVWCHENCCTYNAYINTYTCDICRHG